jgi:hypothetical protein
MKAPKGRRVVATGAAQQTRGMRLSHTRPEGAKACFPRPFYLNILMDRKD